MEETIEANVKPEVVWAAWERAHGQIAVGRRNKEKFKYEILDVNQGNSFSILWKSYLTRLIFHHQVRPTEKGSLISYQIELKGFLGKLVKWFIQEKTKKNLKAVLNDFVLQLHRSDLKNRE